MMLLLFVLVPAALAVAVGVVVASFFKPHGAHAFADPADRTDPDGAAYIGALMEDPDDGFWEQHAPTSRVEVLARPGLLDMLPPDADPDVTLVQPADVKYLGKPSTEWVDEVFDKHAPKPELLP